MKYSDLKLDARRGNRHQSAGITAREAKSIFGCMVKLDKIMLKDNLYVGYQQKLLDAILTLESLLEDADRA
jgi:hypothetical protein